MQIAQHTDRWAVRIIVSVAVIVVCYELGSAGCERQRQSYVMVDELITKRLGSELGRELRVHGVIRPGSLERSAGESRFVLAKSGYAIRVVARMPWPKCVRDGWEAVVRGRLLVDANGWYLDSTELLYRCPSKYAGTFQPCAESEPDTTYR